MQGQLIPQKNTFCTLRQQHCFIYFRKCCAFGHPLTLMQSYRYTFSLCTGCYRSRLEKPKFILIRPDYVYILFQQVVKLHTKLGKPIPSSEPSVVSQGSSSSTAAPSKTASSLINSSTSSTTSNLSTSSSISNASYLKSVGMVTSASQSKNPMSSSVMVNSVKKVNTPKINFVGRSCFSSSCCA